MASNDTPRDENSRDWQRREPFIRRFEAAWQRGERPAIDAHLPADAADRAAVLVELVHAELESRLKAGDAVRVEDYLARFPELADDTAAVLDLIAAEIVLRRRAEPDLDLEAYLQRFPRFREEVAARWGSAGESSLRTVVQPPAPLPAIPGYEMLRLVARGGMGTVYLARQPRLDRLVAIKVLDGDAAGRPGFAERFSREGRALARLNHPHIIAIHDLGEAGELCYLVMEYVDGRNLRQRLQDGKLPPDLAVHIAGQVCDALQYAHEEGIVHRDVKPENVLLDRKDRVKVADFGLAKLLPSSNADAVPLTGPQQVMGTLHYMAPEQLRRPLEVDHRADLYSLGVLLYEMLTGELPLGRFAPPSHVTEADQRLDAVVLRLLEKEPERRFASAAEVESALDALAAPKTVSIVVPTLDEPAPSAGLPVRFFLRVLGAFLAGWLATAAALNFGLAGLLSAGTLMTLLAGIVLARATARLPEVRQELRQRSRSLAAVNTGLGLLLFLLACGALVAAHFAWWDRSIIDPASFSTLYRGQEQRLMQQLRAFKDGPVPAVELVVLNITYTATEKLAIWLAQSGCLLLLGAALLVLETPRWRNTWGRHWQPALVLTAALLLPLPVLHVVAGVLRGFSPTLETVPSRRVSTNANMDEILDRLHRWAEDNDYELQARGTWKLETLHNRETVVQVIWLETYRRPVFARWHLTWQGPERRTPLLKIQGLCSSTPREALVTIDTGPIRQGSREGETWRSVLDGLETALKESAQQGPSPGMHCGPLAPRGDGPDSRSESATLSDIVLIDQPIPHRQQHRRRNCRRAAPGRDEFQRPGEAQRVIVQDAVAGRLLYLGVEDVALGRDLQPDDHLALDALDQRLLRIRRLLGAHQPRLGARFRRPLSGGAAGRGEEGKGQRHAQDQQAYPTAVHDSTNRKSLRTVGRALLPAPSRPRACSTRQVAMAASRPRKAAPL